jgi:hypothetical protein
MAVKKSEIYSSLWEGCDELRGSTGIITEADFNDSSKLGSGKEKIDLLTAPWRL